jgi:hypothetical protein
MNMEVGKVGFIKEGKHKGWHIKIQDDSENTGGFLVLYNQSPTFSSDLGSDDWVENIEALSDYFDESKLKVEWYE